MGNFPSYSSTSYDILWQRLPDLLVMLILDKLEEPIDYVRFAAVCKDWYRIAKDKYICDTDRWYHRPRPPMLLLPPTPAVNRSRLLNFCQVTVYGNNCLRLPQEYESGRKIVFRCGAGHGWLAKVGVHINIDDDPQLSESEWQIELVNPFRQATTLTIPLFTLDRIRFSKPKVIFSFDLAFNADNLWVLAFYTGSHELSFHKRGEKNCISFKGRGARFTDAIFYKGRFYAIDNLRGCILSFDVEDAKGCVYKIDRFERNSHRLYKSYLVESTKGDLLYLHRFVKEITYSWNETTSFKVYKLELENQSSSTVVTQVEVTNIEDETIFIGDTPSISVLASNFCGCRPNSIYFTDDSVTLPGWVGSEVTKYFPEGVKYDGGIFSLADKSITPIITSRHFVPPSWITTAPPFDPLPGFNLTEWTSISKEDKKKRRKHWLSCLTCFSTNE